MVALDLASSNSIMKVSSTKPKNQAMVTTKNKDYGNVNPLNGQTTNQPATIGSYSKCVSY